MGIQPVNHATFTQCMEQLQEGYVFSVAATAGCLVEVVQRDRCGIDVTFVRPRGSTVEEVSVQAQLKNTTIIEPDPSKHTFPYKF